MRYSTRLYLLIILVIFLWVFTIIAPIYIKTDFINKISENELFISLNSLFSGLTFAGILYTIFLQKKELMNQKEQIKNVKESTESSLQNQLKTHTHLINRFNFELFPYIEIIHSSINSKNNFILSNNSSNPAFDIEMIILYDFDDDEYPRTLFIENYNKQRIDKGKPKVNFSQFYPNKSRYYYVSQSNKISSIAPKMDKYIPQKYKPFTSVNIIIQYRDFNKNNYIQFYRFYENGPISCTEHINTSDLTQVMMKPSVPEIKERYLFKKKLTENFDFEHYEEIENKTFNELLEYFKLIYNSSVSEIYNN